MKRDFSQEFENGSVHYELLIQHAVTKKFLLFKSTEYFEEDWYRTLTFKAYDQEFTQALAKYLYDNQLLLNGYRELARQTDVSFSFVDKTPGSKTTSVCLLVVVDVPEGAELGRENEQAVFVDLGELLPRFSTSPGIGSLSYLGVAHLRAEAKELGQAHP